ncbi:MAG: Hpt domain-containing protein [Gammaproteobacteria bacterium]|nr:Hpt domain-containing protein [Gammaproteobacteria bacterium]
MNIHFVKTPATIHCMEDFKKILKELADNYLEALPDTLHNVELLLVNFKQHVSIENYQTLFREIHSIKGSAGTHNFSFLSAICHQFEDELSELSPSTGDISDQQVNNWLAYIDLLIVTTELYQQQEDNFSNLEDKLNLLRSQHGKHHYSCLLVESESSSTNIVKSALEAHSFQVSLMNDGYQSLGRLLTDKYDLLITGMHVETLNGVGLIGAIRSSTSVNKKIPAILLTSGKFNRNIRQSDPDYIVYKDKDLIANLDAAISSVKENHKN